MRIPHIGHKSLETSMNSLEELKAKNPLVHCITNYVSMDIAANTLLAVGASPAMIHTPEESGDFSPVAGALTVNIGTISPNWLEGMEKAIQAANKAKVPWVLDPVAHFATPYRQTSIARLISLEPSVVRGNASEILALQGEETEAKGVDSQEEVETALNASKKLAKKHNCTIFVTGEIDIITDGVRVTRVSGGSSFMSSVTAIGCSLTCLVGAFTAITDPYTASVSAATLFAEAGHKAKLSANGPGSFRTHFLDQLSLVNPHNFSNLKWADSV